jgi:hypothetical protein
MPISRIRLRRGTAADWVAGNPVLAAGEPGVELDTGKQKIGDGVKAWTALGYTAAKGDQGAPGVADDASVKSILDNPASQTATKLSATILTQASAAITPSFVLPDSNLVVLPGDSLTASTGVNWPVTHFQPYTGMTAVNAGVSGQAVADILFRVGAIKPRVTIAGNTIPASGSVAITSIDPSKGWRINGTGTFGFEATIAGVPGSLQHNLVADTWAFIRTTAGDAVTVQPNTLVERPAAFRYPRHRLVAGAGRNNALDGTLPVSARLMELLPTAQDTQVKEILVWGVINGTDEPTGHARRAAIIEYNDRLKAFYGENFYDIRRDFIDTGLTRAGISPTAQDTTNIAADCPPPSLMADNIHPNAAGYEVLARLLAEKVKALGWVNTITIPADPGIVLTSDSFNRADTAAGTLGTTDSAYGGTAKVWTSESQVQILSNQVGAATLTSNRHSYVDEGRTDGHVHLKVLVVGDGCGVIARWVDNQNYYYVSITAAGAWGLYKRVAGTGTPILTGTGTVVNGDVIGLSVQGSTFKLYRNGTLAGTITDTSHTTGTRFGMRSAFNNIAYRVDDYKFTDK